MSELDRFFESRTEGERVIGTYLYPLRLFGDLRTGGTLDPRDPFTATEVVRRVPIGSHEVLVTRTSGLFVLPPDTFSNPYQDQSVDDMSSDLKAKMSFEEEVAASFNQLICELALMGIVSEPASPLHISYGQMINGHALVTSGGGGGRERYVERTLAPSLALLRGDWLTWHVHEENVLDAAAEQACTTRLAAISPSIPILVAGAYSLFSQRQLAEALIDGWIVTEQILDHLWDNYLAQAGHTARRQRLADRRTYTASVQAEVLFTAQVLSAPIYDSIQKARKRRNDLAHRAEIGLQAASDSMTAMKALIEFVCGREVAAPAVTAGVTW